MKLSKRTKTILTSSVSILGVTSIVTPLATMTSCSNQTSEIESQFDKEYGVTEQTYDDLKDQFLKQYEVKLLNEGRTEKIDANINYLKKQLSSLDKMKEQKKNGFTSLTSAMMDFAKKDSHDLDGNPYNINLSRKTKATWAQIDGIFNSWKGSFRQYMLNSDMPASTITRVMQDAQNKFVSLKKELQQTCNDALDGIIQAKSRIITCFEDVNDEIALVSSTLQLKEFLSQYVFEPKAPGDTGFELSCLDKLLEDTEAGNCDFAVGNVLSDDTINRIFNVYRKEDGADHPITFTNTIIKGHTLFPKLTKISSNKLANVYTFSLDFGLTKTSYIGKYSKDQLANVTAHTYVSDDFNSDDINDDTSLSDLIHKMSIKSIDYTINLSLETEKQTLLDTYFNKKADYGHISFNWDNKNANNQAYESFFDNAVKQTDGTWKANLTSESLKNSWIRISNDESSYKFINNISSSIVEREDKEIKLKNLSEQFLDSCDFSANVTINEKDVEKKIVKIDSFYVNYSNSVYKTNSDGKLDLKNTDYLSYQEQCVNHQVSKSFYEKVNNKFNEAVRYVTIYDASVINAILGSNGETKEEKLEEVMETADQQKLISIGALVAGSIATGVAVYKAWSPASGVNTRKIIIVSLIFLFVCLGLQAATFALFMTQYYNKLVEHVEEERAVRNDLRELPILRHLKEDSSNYVLFDDDGSYDKTQFNERMKKFNQHNFDWMLDQYRKYSNVETGEWEPFQNCINNAKVGDEDYKDKFEDWKLGGKWWLISLGLTLFTLIASIFLGKWINKQRREYRDKINEIKYSRLESESPVKAYMNQFQNTLESSFKSNCFAPFASMGKIISLADAKTYCRLAWSNVAREYHHELYSQQYEDRDPDLDLIKGDKLKEYINRQHFSPGVEFDWDIQTYLDVLGLSIG